MVDCGYLPETGYIPDTPDLSSVPISDLVDELKIREGVEEIAIAPDEGFVAANCGNDHQNMLQERRGPARIMVVID